MQVVAVRRVIIPLFIIAGGRAKSGWAGYVHQFIDDGNASKSSPEGRVMKFSVWTEAVIRAVEHLVCFHWRQSLSRCCWGSSRRVLGFGMISCLSGKWAFAAAPTAIGSATGRDIHVKLLHFALLNRGGPSSWITGEPVAGATTRSRASHLHLLPS